MHNAFINKINEFKNSAEAYAIAIIVRRKIPSSGKPGDKAIITADGHIHGWIGGGCTRGIVLKEALLSIKERKPRFVSISPSKIEGADENTKVYAMTCQSGGEVELYIEPVLPKPQLVIFGTSHIAKSLAKVAKAIDYQVDVVMSSADKNVFPEVDNVIGIKDLDSNQIKSSAYIVVCTQGEGDAEALQKALAIGSSYLSFVASRKKANAIYREVRGMGASFDQLKTIKTPAGLDIGAKMPDEVAISILAEIIKHYRAADELVQANEEDKGEIILKNEDFYINPVCNIPVQKSTAKHVINYKEKDYYFCCDGCKVSFEKEPDKYALA